MKDHLQAIYARSTDELSSYRARVVFIVAIFFSITAGVSVVLRLAAKRISKARLVIEDYLILIALAVNYVHTVLVMLALFTASIGHHANTVPPSHSAQFFKLLLPFQIIYGVILGLIKVSICLFYNRIFFIRRFRIASYIVIGFITTWSVGAVLTALIICRPIAFNWDHTIQGGKCGSQTNSFIAVGVTDLIIDCAVFALPVPMIWNLQVSSGKRVALFGIFGLGVSTMVLAILRIQALVTLDLEDITYTASYPLLFSFLEPAIGITVACGPLFGPLVKVSRFGRFFSQKSKSRDYHGSSTFSRMKEAEHEMKDFSPKVTTTTTVTTSRASNNTGTKKNSAIKHGSTFFDGGSETRILPEPESGIVVQKEWQMGRV